MVNCDDFRYTNHVRFVNHLFLDFSGSNGTFRSPHCPPSLSNYGKHYFCFDFSPYNNIWFWFQGTVATLTAYFRRRVVEHTDKRVALMNEVINSIRLIKMYAWEIPFSDKIQKIRIAEMRALQKTAFLQSISFSITPCITVVAAVVTVIALT